MWPLDEVKWDREGQQLLCPVQHDLERGERDSYTTDEVALVRPCTSHPALKAFRAPHSQGVGLCWQLWGWEMGAGTWGCPWLFSLCLACCCLPEQPRGLGGSSWVRTW